MSLYNLIKSLELVDNLPKPELYSNVKLISDYVEPNLSSLNKNDLINLILGLKIYLNNKSTSAYDSDTFMFGDQKIKLDKEQLSIVKADPDLNMRVIAGAGSGKTTTILCRVKYILDNYTTPDRILILTFNRDSAQNLRNRISSLFGFPIHIQIYTIDAFCLKLINYYKYDTDIKVFSLSEYSNTGLNLMSKYGKEISSQYKYIFFDEFQDVNDVQFSILKIFTDNGCVLTVIGDDCQNIYQFRGTNNYYMINFDKIIDSKTFKLTTNYRCGETIINIANRSISFNELRIEKKMNAYNKSKEKPKLVMCPTESDSVDYICKKIYNFIESGILLHNIAILSRNSYPLKMIETEFTKRSIEHVACITDKTTDDIKKILVPNKIAVTTIHKSKGLEWDVVFILGLSHEHFPEHLNNNIRNIEEERRLFYVGVTRCKNNLFLVANKSELPLSIFIREVYDLLSNVRYRGAEKILDSDLFSGSDTESITKESYGVNELISLLTPNDLHELRKIDLLPNIVPNKKTFVESEIKFQFTKKIKEYSYEPDLGEFCDRYITRGIISKLNDQFVDFDTEQIIKCEKTNQNQNNINNQNNIRKFTYPPNVLKEIDRSYLLVKNNSISNRDLLKEIYWISLCRNFCNDRNRLAFKNIYSIIEENLLVNYQADINQPDQIKLIDRLDMVINQSVLKTNPICKVNVKHTFITKKDPDKKCRISGEIDMIDIESNNLIDFKCSESEYKLEWMVQLLIYYSLLDKKIRNSISVLSIINVFDGLMYSIDIKPGYQSDKLIRFLETKIINDQQSIRPKPSICFDSVDKPGLILKKQPELISFNYKPTQEYFMILDTETSDFNGDIIQLAWIVFDSSNQNKIISKHSYYIKDRLTSKDSYLVHKISVDKLRNCGELFDKVIKYFIQDLEKVSTVIGHNVSYDLRCIIKNLRKYDIILYKNNELTIGDKQIHNVFDLIDIQCTKKLSGGKSLDSLYTDLYKEKMLDAHDALVDVLYTYKCYIKLIENINNLENNNQTDLINQFNDIKID